MTPHDSPENGMPVSRSRLLQGVAGLGPAAGLASTSDASASNGGDNGAPAPGNGNGNGNTTTTVPLITGQTIQVSEAGNDRQYTVTSDHDAEAFHFVGIEDDPTLRFGVPAAITQGNGAPPARHHRNNGMLWAVFAARKTGLSCGTAPVGGQLAGTLSDGTALSGATVITQMRCSGATGDPQRGVNQ